MDWNKQLMGVVNNNSNKQLMGVVNNNSNKQLMGVVNNKPKLIMDIGCGRK